MNNQNTGIALSTEPTKILQNIALQIRAPTNASPNSTGISQAWATQTSSPVKISHLQKHKDVLSKDNLWEKRVVLFMEGLTSETATFSLFFLLDYLANPRLLYKTF